MWVRGKAVQSSDDALADPTQKRSAVEKGILIRLLLGEEVELRERIFSLSSSAPSHILSRLSLLSVDPPVQHHQAGLPELTTLLIWKLPPLP